MGRIMKILILCTGNSIRSQMAEGFFGKFRKDWEVKSAGTNPGGINPDAVKVMSEIGIDISGQRSKNVMQFTSDIFDYVITVCDHAKDVCPVFPGKARLIHWSIKDPAAVREGEERLDSFRKVRDEIRERILGFLSRVDGESGH